MEKKGPGEEERINKTQGLWSRSSWVSWMLKARRVPWM